MDNVTLIGIIVIALLGGLFVIKAKMDAKKENSSSGKDEKNVVSNHELKTNENMKKIPKKDVFDFMEFDKVEDDMIVQQNGERFTMVIQCKGINYDLMSDIEQLSIEEGFIVFLNTLKYPIQLYVQARSIDLKKSMNVYKERVDAFGKQYENADNKYRKIMNKIEASENEIDTARNNRAKFANIYEYATDISRYVEKLSISKNILQRRFYIAISYSKSDITVSGSFQKSEVADICRRELYTRAQSLISSLMTCSVQGKILTSDALAELLYVSYNRDDERILDIRSAIDADVYRLYSNGKDVYDKKKEKLQEEIKNEAIRRVQDAIRKTVRQRDIKSQYQIEEEFENDTDKAAVEIIRNSELSEEDKEELTEVIAQEHIERKVDRNARMKADAELKRKIKEQKDLETQNQLSKDDFEETDTYIDEITNEPTTAEEIDEIDALTTEDISDLTTNYDYDDDDNEEEDDDDYVYDEDAYNSEDTVYSNDDNSDLSDNLYDDDDESIV